jgi:hypothetical protein
MWAAVFALTVILAGAAGCGARRPPVDPALVALPSRQPVILVPGMIGTKLVNEETGKTVWGTGRALVTPRDGGYGMALPLDPEAAGSDPVEPTEAILRVRMLGVYTYPVYAPLVRLLEGNGYRLGDLDAPQRGDTLFLFGHEWRGSNVASAARLGEALERLRRVRGDETLRVTLICQSNGARIARYFIKYGGSSLEAAESGDARPPDNVRVDKLILVGTANGGAVRVLEQLNRGRSFASPLGRRLRPEALFTFRSLYQALPDYRDDYFVGENGETLDVDLYDPANWETYGWSIFDPEVARRADRERYQDLFGDVDDRTAFLATWLDRSRRLHALLDRDVPWFGDTRYYMIQNATLPTMDRAVLVREDGRWRTYFGDDRRVKRDPVLATLTVADGDGHAPAASQMDLSPQELDAIARDTVRVEGEHFPMIRGPEAEQAILEILRD